MINELGVEILSWAATIAMFAALVVLALRLYLVVGAKLYDLTIFVVSSLTGEDESDPPRTRAALAALWPLTSIICVPISVFGGAYLIGRPVFDWVWRNLLVSALGDRAPRARVVREEADRE